MLVWILSYFDVYVFFAPAGSPYFAPSHRRLPGQTHVDPPASQRRHTAAANNNNNKNMASHGLDYEGCNFFRQRLVLSTLSGKRVKIKGIRSRDDEPGLRGELGPRLHRQQRLAG